MRPSAEAMLEEAARRGVVVPVEAWSRDGDSLHPDAHLDRLRSMVTSDHPVVATVRTDPMQLDRMIDVAGEIIAWGGRRI
jgi:hypothetical protein